MNCDSVKTGDQGQRYECQMTDGDGKRIVMGWTDTTEGIKAMRKSVELHPTWHDFGFIDRRPE